MPCYVSHASSRTQDIDIALQASGFAVKTFVDLIGFLCFGQCADRHNTCSNEFLFLLCMILQEF